MLQNGETFTYHVITKSLLNNTALRTVPLGKCLNLHLIKSFIILSVLVLSVSGYLVSGNH